MPIEKRKLKTTNSYVVRVQDRTGKWFPSRSFRRKADAEFYERTLMQKRDLGERAVILKSRDILFRDFVEKWFTECRSIVSAGWVASQRQMISSYAEPILGELRIGEIEGAHINSVFLKMRHLGLSESTILLTYATLHKLFDDAVEEFNLLTRNPVKKKYRPKIRRTEQPFLRPEESWKLLRASEHEPIGTVIWLGLLAGLRISEIQSLKVRDIDLLNGQITIKSCFSRRTMQIQSYPKQGDWGRAPIPKALSVHLAKIVRTKLPDDFVVSGSRNEILSHNSILRNLRRICDLAGVLRMSPHGLRHSCTELYVEQGASIEDIRRLLNHKSGSSATQRYIHRTDERLTGIAAEISSEFCGPKLRAV